MSFDNWIGRTETSSDVITPMPLAALSATLDHPPDRPLPGTPLPPLWHWLYFLPLHRQSDIGPDGHALKGGFLPPIPLPRRMWAGSQFEFNEPLRIGDAVTRISTISGVTEKKGRTGPLAFVKVRHDISREGPASAALTEYHDIVYRGAPSPEDPPSPPQPAPGGGVWEKIWRPDEVFLFRYSALTFNGHRIHYDRRYVTEVEGYPGVVVHGPLIATLLVELLRRHLPEAWLASFRFRAIRPTFDTNSFSVCGKPEPGGKTVHLWAKDHEGWLTMEGTAVIR
jgi:3-methylfumaryl-CoA hydratase